MHTGNIKESRNTILEKVGLASFLDIKSIYDIFYISL